MSRSHTASHRGTETKIPPSLSPSLPPSINQVEVEFKTDDGQTKKVKIHRKGTDVLYKGLVATVPALILDVRLDRLFEPHYTVRLVGGGLKKADNDHIKIETLFARCLSM